MEGHQDAPPWADMEHHTFAWMATPTTVGAWADMLRQVTRRSDDPASKPDLVYMPTSALPALASKLGIKLKSPHRLPRRLRPR